MRGKGKRERKRRHMGASSLQVCHLYSTTWQSHSYMLYVEGSFFAPYNIDDVSIDNLTAFDDNAGKRKEEGGIMV